MNSMIELDTGRYNQIVANLSAVDSDDRRWAIFDLESFPPDMIAEHLIHALEDENRGVREAASEILETVPPELTVKHLTPLLGNRRIEVRNLVAAILVKFGDQGVSDLISALQHPEEDVRKFAADILGLIGSESAIKALGNTILNDSVENVVVSAIEALGKIAKPEALPVLYKVIKNGQGMITEAAEAIGIIGLPESANFLEEQVLTDDPVFRYAIVDALGNIGEVSSIQVLQDLMQNSDKAIHEQICRALFKIAYKQQLNIMSFFNGDMCECLFRDISEIDSDLISLINYQIENQNSRAFKEHLFTMTEQLPSSIIVNLLKSCDQDENCFDDVQALINHPDDWVSFTAIEVLGSYQNEQLPEVLKLVLLEQRSLPSIAAMKVAANNDIHELKSCIKKLITSENQDIQTIATQIIEEWDRI